MGIITHQLWRLVNSRWRIIKGLYSVNYACCSTYERILPIGERPSK